MTGHAGADRPADWSVEIRRDDAAFDSLQADWAALYAGCLTATPFQSWGWLVSWWRSYGVPGDLRLVLVRRSGELVAALPLMLRRRYGHRVLVPVGDEISDHVDVLADGRWSGQALSLVAEALLRLRGWAAIDLIEVRPAALVWRLAALWPETAGRFPSSPCMQSAFGSADGYLAALPKSHRKKMRRAWNKAESRGLSARAVPPGELDAAVTTLIRLHQAQWQDREVTPEHLRSRFARHLTAALSVMVPAGQAAVTEYVLAGKVVAVYMIVIGHDMAAGYLYGIDPAARAEFDFMPLFVTRIMELAERNDSTVISLLRGAEPHKEYWRFERIPNERLVLAGRHRLPAASYLAIVRCRSALVALVKEHLPRIHPLLVSLRSRASGGGRAVRRPGPAQQHLQQQSQPHSPPQQQQQQQQEQQQHEQHERETRRGADRTP